MSNPPPGGPLPTPNWEALREGIDDFRYLYQLETLAREKAASHPDAAAEAERYLDQLRSRCDLDERTMINEFGDWTPETFSDTRARTIGLILKMMEL